MLHCMQWTLNFTHWVQKTESTSDVVLPMFIWRGFKLNFVIYSCPTHSRDCTIRCLCCDLFLAADFAPSSLLSHVHGLISSLSASPKHIWYNPCWPTFVTFLASFSHASYPGSWQKLLHFKIITGQGRGKGAKCLKITFGTRILYHTWHLHCFSHPGEWKGLCSKPQSELTSEAAWNSLQRKSIVL